MLRGNSWKSKNAKTCCPKRNREEVEPKAGLAYTPADMARMHAAGMPVNSANLVNQFYDGDKNPSFDVALERQRGVDPAELWEVSQTAKAKIKKLGKAYKNHTKNT